MRTVIYCTLFILLLISSACSPFYQSCSAPCTKEKEPYSSGHWIYRYIPEHRSQINSKNQALWFAWAFFGNDDDGVFGEKSKKFHAQMSLGTAISWQLRNPLHNFCFYVIGSAGKENDELDICKITKKGVCLFHYHAVGTTVYGDEDTSFYLGLHGNKPFISLRLRYAEKRELNFYFGWRERGNFGLLFNPFRRVREKA